MPTPPEVRAAILSHQDAVTQVRTQVDTHANNVWSGMTSYRDRDIDRMVDAITPVSLGAQQRIVALTDNYLTAVAEAAGSKRPQPTVARSVTGTALRGVPPREVYRRAGVTIWSALADGVNLTDAVEQGLNRLTNMLMTDLQLTKTHTTRMSFASDGSVAGYRRVLKGSKNCGLCTLASTQRYHKERLMPIHPGCDCGVAPIRGNVDPGQVIDPDRLEALHEAANKQLGVSDRGGRTPDYRKITVHDHGELGPVLSWRGQKFTGPGDIP